MRRWHTVREWAQFGTKDPPPTISIDDAALIEPDTGTTSMTLPVTLTVTSGFTVTAAYTKLVVRCTTAAEGSAQALIDVFGYLQ